MVCSRIMDRVECKPQTVSSKTNTHINTLNSARVNAVMMVLIICDYIVNHTFQSRNNKNGYIVTQLPLRNTIMDFWRLIYDHASNVIISLNPLDEDQEVRSKFKVLFFLQIII